MAVNSSVRELVAQAHEYHAAQQPLPLVEVPLELQLVVADPLQDDGSVGGDTPRGPPPPPPPPPQHDLGNTDASDGGFEC
eukprot:4423218-Amphidinium_carterae.1